MYLFSVSERSRFCEQIYYNLLLEFLDGAYDNDDDDDVSDKDDVVAVVFVEISLLMLMMIIINI